MTQGAIIGIDVGTTTVKASVLDPDGTLRARFARSYETARPGASVVEQDPEDWVRLIDAAFEEMAGYPAAAIGMCSQTNTHVFVDADGRALCPAIQWQDGRAAAEAAALDARVTPAQKRDWWGAPMPIDASHAVARMTWMARHRPDIWERTRWVMLPKDYCLLKLTGEATTDPLSNIGLVGADLRYIPSVLDLVPGAAERLAPLLGIMEVAGRVVRGPHRGTPVVTGTMDAWAGLVGTGGATDRSTIYLSGTSEILGISSHKVVPTPGVVVFPACAGLRVHAAPTQNGGDAKLWFCELTGITPEEMARMVAATPRRVATPLFLPQRDGERAPLWDAGLRGAFLGISRGTTLPDMARAVYEGVAFSARHALEALQASGDLYSEVISCGGGGFRSSVWGQIRADVLGVPLRRLALGEPGVLGAAILAAIGTGRYHDLAEASRMLARYDRTFAPDERATARIDRVFALYKDAVAANADAGRRLADAAGTV